MRASIHRSVTSLIQIALAVVVCSAGGALPAYAQGATADSQAPAEGSPPAAQYPATGAPAGYPPPGYPPPGYPQAGYPPPGYPPPGYPQAGFQQPIYSSPDVPTEPVEEEPATPQFRPFRFRIDFGFGGFSPTQVNRYLASKMPSNGIMESGTTDMILIFQLEAAFAYYFIPYLGIRPSVTYLFSPKAFVVQGGSSEGFWLHSIAPGISIDGALPVGRVARLFLSPGLAYQAGWLDSFSASGLGITVTGGVDLSFGTARSKGLYIAGTFRKANLGVSGTTRYNNSSGSGYLTELDFTSFMVSIGFQLSV
jgi:hypothetical protein